MFTALLFALGLMVVGISRMLRNARLRQEAWVARAARAEGTIQVPKEYFDLSLRQYRPIAEAEDPPPGKAVFKARDGHEYAVTAGRHCEEGQTVTVLYDPDSPSTATLDTAPPGRWMEVVARSIGGLLLTAALIAFWLDARQGVGP